MKELIAIICVFIGQIAAELLTIDHALKVNEHIYNRFKRQLGFQQQQQDSNSNDYFCPLQCLGIALNAALESNNIPTDPFRTNGQYFTQADQQRFRDACRTYQEMKNCWRPCPKSFLTDLTASTYETMDYLCGPNFEDWNRYMPCFVNVGKQVAAECSQRCNNFTQGSNIQQQMNSLGNTFSNTINSNNNQLNIDGMGGKVGDIMSQVLDSSCQYIKCSTDCERPQLVEKCGQRAATLLEGLVSVSMSSLNQMTQLENPMGDSSSGFSSSNSVYSNNQYGYQQQVSNQPKMPFSCSQLIKQYNPNVVRG